MQEHQGDVLIDVSNAMARLYEDRLGPGPTRVRSPWAGDDALICILDDTLDASERELAALGAHDRLREARLFMQYAMIGEFCRPVELITGRTLRAFHSCTDTEADGQSVEVFVFHPAGYDGASRIKHARP